MKIEKGKKALPWRIMLVGQEGVGKTTFGAGAPKPLFLCSERGAEHVGVDRVHVTTWAEVMAAVEEISKNQNGYETLVIDTVDALEPMVYEHICTRDKQRDVESYGYGKGYVVALIEWRELLSRLDDISHKMHVIMLAHVAVKNFKNPAGPDYDRYEPALHAKVSGLLKAWSDLVLFAQFSTTTKKDGLRTKGLDGQTRKIYTQRCAAWDAKTRVPCRAEIDMSWDGLMAELNTDDTDALRESCAEMALQLGDEKVNSWIATKAKTATREQLAQAHNRLKSRLEEQDNGTA